MKQIKQSLVLNIVLSLTIFTPKSWAYTTLEELFSILLQPHALVFDIGAHTGTKTQTYLAYGARVVCVEPQPCCQKKLIQKFRDQVEIVTIEPYALATECGTIELHICSQAPTISTCTEHWQHGRFNNYTWNKTITVPTKTLDTLIAQYGTPIFCKIDVEGFEYMVLAGLTQKIGCISFEWTHEFVHHAQACLKHLSYLGYTQFSLTCGEDTHFIFKTPQSADTVLSWIEHNDDPLCWGDIYAFA